MDFETLKAAIEENDINQVIIDSATLENQEISDIIGMIDTSGQLVIDITSSDTDVIYNKAVISIKGNCNNLLFAGMPMFAHIFLVDNNAEIILHFLPSHSWKLGDAYPFLSGTFLESGLNLPIFMFASDKADFNIEAWEYYESILAGKTLEANLELINELVPLQSLFNGETSLRVRGTYETVEDGTQVTFSALYESEDAPIALGTLSLSAIELTLVTLLEAPMTSETSAEETAADTSAETSPPNIQVGFASTVSFGADNHELALTAEIDLAESTAVIEATSENGISTDIDTFASLIGEDDLALMQPDTVSLGDLLAFKSMSVEATINPIQAERINLVLGSGEGVAWEITTGLSISELALQVVWYRDASPEDEAEDILAELLPQSEGDEAQLTATSIPDSDINTTLNSLVKVALIGAINISNRV